MQKYVSLVDLVESFPMSIFLLLTWCWWVLVRGRRWRRRSGRGRSMTSSPRTACRRCRSGLASAGQGIHYLLRKFAAGVADNALLLARNAACAASRQHSPRPRWGFRRGECVTSRSTWRSCPPADCRCAASWRPCERAALLRSTDVLVFFFRRQTFSHFCSFIFKIALFFFLQFWFKFHQC